MNKRCSHYFSKQPSEFYTISMDFSDNMEDGESIVLGSSSVAAVHDADGSGAPGVLDSSSLAVVDGTKLAITVKAGEDGKDYVITFQAYISATKKLEEDLGMVVRD